MSVCFTGCGSVGYLLQAGKGQMALITHARPIAEVLQDEKTPPRVKKLLGEIAKIKQFGESYGLKPTHNYTEFVKLDRKAAVWVVSACEPLRFKSKHWSFPIVGSFPYLGWFNLDSAKDYKKELEAEGWEVDLRGASAYSTLGWFRDAVLSSMIAEGSEALGELVNVVLHESVHATLYFEGQAYFNESLATYVADHLTRLFLEEKPEVDRIAYQNRVSQGREIEKIFHAAYLQLETLYQSSRSDLDKREAKKSMISTLQGEILDRFKIRREINNATLVQYKTYYSGYEDFNQLLRRCELNILKMMKSLAQLRKTDFDSDSPGKLGQLLKRVSCS